MFSIKVNLIKSFNNLSFSDTPKRFFPMHWVSWIVSTVGIIMVLLAHGHYSVDVIIAYYVTTRLFWTYHTLANNVQLKVSIKYFNYFIISELRNWGLSPKILSFNFYLLFKMSSAVHKV